VLNGRVQPDRRRVGDEVHVVAARSQLQAELRGDDAGAAVSWVASNADAHSRSPARVLDSHVLNDQGRQRIHRSLDADGGFRVTRLAGKVAFITGGGTGIGRACAMEFARQGASVALAGRRHEPLAAAVAEITAAGGRARATPCDVTARAEVEAALAATEK